MGDLKDMQKRIEEIREPHGPDVLGRDKPMPPTEPTQPFEDEDEEPIRNLPKGAAGY